MRVNKKISEDSTELIIQKFEELVNNCVEKNSTALARVNQLLNDENDIISDFCRPLLELKSTLQGLSTKYLQNTKIKKGPFVSPVEINIQSTDNIVYIPIIETLKLLLRHEDILSFISVPHKKSHPNIISDFSCGERFKDTILFSLPNTFQIILYIDDFTLTNPLGTSAKKHKLCAIYFSIGNIPYYLQSKLYTIQLISLFPSRLVKKIGYEILLKQLVNDLKSLEEGVDIDTPLGVTKFHASISLLIADNLAAHEIGGFVASFSAFRRTQKTNRVNSWVTGGYTLPTVQLSYKLHCNI